MKEFVSPKILVFVSNLNILPFKMFLCFKCILRLVMPYTQSIVHNIQHAVSHQYHSMSTASRSNLRIHQNVVKHSNSTIYL